MVAIYGWCFWEWKSDEKFPVNTILIIIWILKCAMLTLGYDTHDTNYSNVSQWGSVHYTANNKHEYKLPPYTQTVSLYHSVYSRYMICQHLCTQLWSLTKSGITRQNCDEKGRRVKYAHPMQTLVLILLVLNSCFFHKPMAYWTYMISPLVTQKTLVIALLQCFYIY